MAKGTSGHHHAQKSEAARFAAQFVDSAEYRDSLWHRIKSNTLAPAIETLLLAYRYGKPVDRQEMTFPEGIPNYTDLSITELAARAGELSQSLAEAKQMVEKLDAEERFPTEFDSDRPVM